MQPNAAFSPNSAEAQKLLADLLSADPVRHTPAKERVRSAFASQPLVVDGLAWLAVCWTYVLAMRGNIRGVRILMECGVSGALSSTESGDQVIASIDPESFRYVGDLACGIAA